VVLRLRWNAHAVAPFSTGEPGGESSSLQARFAATYSIFFEGTNTMGVKTTISGLTYAATHRATATAAAQNVDSLHREIILQAQELTKNLQILVATMRQSLY
jgi:hypothetical protein